MAVIVALRAVAVGIPLRITNAVAHSAIVADCIRKTEAAQAVAINNEKRERGKPLSFNIGRAGTS